MTVNIYVLFPRAELSVFELITPSHIIMENIDWSIWYFESVSTITEGYVTWNRPISFEYFHLTYNK